MNQPVLKEKKQSTGRLSVASSSLRNSSSAHDIKRKGLSLNKKCQQIEEICASKTNQGKYLMGWGKIPSLGHSSNVQLINKDIVSFDCGEDHLVFVNNRHQAFAIGKNQFGQLGDKQNCIDIINPVFDQHKIKKVFCTPFATFFITQSHHLYACGLNNRGQLGLGHQQKVTSPTLIESLSEELPERDGLNRKGSRNRISSVYYNEVKKPAFQQYSDRGQDSIFRLIDSGERVKQIRGGPFHTVILTTKGRLFYSGNLYKSDSLLKDENTNQFIALNTSVLGKIISVRTYLTGICLQTHEYRVYLLGHFGVHIFDQPFLLGNGSILSYAVCDKGVYLVDSHGQLTFFNTSLQLLRGQKIQTQGAIKQIYAGLDFLLGVNHQKNLVGLGNNSENQLCTKKFRISQQITSLPISFKSQEKIDVVCSNNFVLCLVCKPITCEEKEQSQQNMKFRDLERENKVLKELLCNKNKKNAKIQTEKEGKFEFSRSLNPRVFDNSMEIPFQEISLGRQISEGGYGIIYEAIWRKTTVAVKLFKIEKQNDNSIRDFISECHAMEALRHPNIVMFLGACTKAPHFAIVLEYCPGGTLWSLLQNKNIELSWNQRRQLALDTAKGMNYLHEKPTPILHRDLKSLNLLLDQSRRIKLADFGWTKGLQNYMTGKIGTYQWMAPEVISAFQYTQKADVYSFGIILWEIASRQAPYRNIPGPQVAQEVLSKDLRPSIPRRTPEAFADLIRSCWQKEGPKRPNFSTIISKLESMSLN